MMFESSSGTLKIIASPMKKKKESMIESILVDSSRAVADMANSVIAADSALFEEAWELMMRDEYPLSMRAARVVDESAEKHPALIKPFLDETIRKLTEFRIVGIRRGMLRFLSRTKLHLTPVQRGYLIDTCFGWMNSSEEAIAIRYYSMEILFRISRKEPGIRNELLAALEEGLEKDIYGYPKKPLQYIKTLSREIRKGEWESR